MDAGYAECTGATIICLNGIGTSSPRENSDSFFANFQNDAREYASYVALSSSQQDDELRVADVLSQELARRGKSPFHQSYHAVEAKPHLAVRQELTLKSGQGLK